MASRTAVNCGLSPRCPAVITTGRGFWPCSTARWTFVSGRRGTARGLDQLARSRAARPAGPLFRAPAACWCAWTAAGSMDTSQVTCPAASARVAGRRGPSPRSRRAASAGTARRRSPSAVGRRDVPPRRPGPDPPPDPVYELPSRPLRWPPWLLARGSSGSSTAHCASVRSSRPVTATLVTRSRADGLLGR
jgi:hypothetical protein